MNSLSKELLAIVTTNASTSVEARDTLSRIIIQNATELDNIGAQSDKIPLPENVRTSLVCKAGQLVLGSHAVMPGDGARYQERQQENWSMACWLPAACFLRVQTPLEVAVALRIMTFLKSKFSVRSGGHNPNQGFSSIDQSGLLIDMGAMNAVDLSQDKSVASIGPGATWDQVYEQLEKHEVTVAGGRVKGVGVGGLILGGGMSHFSNHWGLVSDNIKNFEIVLADSSIIQANADSHPDLFKALKGGGPNFGIVTRYDAYTYTDYRLWYTIRVYSASDKNRVMQAAVQVQKAMDKDDKIGFFLTVATGTLTVGMLYREWTDFPPVFRAFDGIPILMEAVPQTNGTQLTVARATAIDSVAKYEIGTVTVKPNAALYADLHNVLQNTAKAPGITLAFTFQPISTSAVTKGEGKGGNVANIPAEMQSWLGIMTQWKDDADDDLARSQIRQLIRDIGLVAESRGLKLDFLFQNDASHVQSPLKSYGPESLAYLSKVASKYDSLGIFQHLQKSGFLLSNA